MTFIQAVKNVLISLGSPVTPQEIKENIVNMYPEFYGTASHKRNVKNGHYQNIDHALLAQIYSAVRTNNDFICDKTTKPMKISLGEKIEETMNDSIRASHEHNEGNQNANRFINNQREYFADSYRQFTIFGGPCIYFHHECLRAGRTDFLSKRHVEMLYATLTAWGLHRMGDAKAKLTDWDNFYDSFSKQADALRQFLPYKMNQLTEMEYSKIIIEYRQCYKKLNLSVSKATIVVNSKALHHLFPDLISPIDRQYTIRFFTKASDQWLDKKGKLRAIQLPLDLDEQFKLFHKTCVDIKKLVDRVDPNIFEEQRRKYHITIPKAVDNAIINYVRKVSGGLISD